MRENGKKFTRHTSEKLRTTKRTETLSPRCRSTSSTSAFQELNGGADDVVEKSRCLSSELARVIKPQGNGTNLWQGQLISATLHGTAWRICVHGVKRFAGSVTRCRLLSVRDHFLLISGTRQRGRKEEH